jgi:TetR/AcrR family transcriptional repressor of mexJK operon
MINSKKHSILEASKSLFLKHGFKDVSISMIVKEASCSRETVYRYFANKEEIFAEIIAHLIETYLSTMKTAIELKTDDLRSGLIDWSQSLIESTMDETYIQFRRLVVAETNTRPEHGKLYFDMTYKKGTKAVEDYLRIFQRKGEIKNIQCERLAKYFVGMMLYEIMHARLFGAKKKPNKKEINRLVETTVDDFLSGFSA